MKRKRQRITVFFTWSDTWESKTVRWSTWSRYSHVTIADNNAVLDMKIEGGALFWPWLHYSHYAQEQGWKAVTVGVGRPNLPKYEGAPGFSKWKMAVKYLSLGFLDMNQKDCVDIAKEILVNAGQDPFPRSCTTPRGLLKQLRKRGYT